MNANPAADLHVLVLGTLARLDQGPALVVDYGIDGVKAHLLTDEQYLILDEWDSTVPLGDPAEPVKQLLKALEGKNAVAVARGVNYTDLNARLVIRQDVKWAPAEDDFLSFTFADGRVITGDQFDAELISRADGLLTLGELVRSIRDAWRAAEPDTVLAIETEHDAPLIDVLTDAALDFTTRFCGTGAVSVEPSL